MRKPKHKIVAVYTDEGLRLKVGIQYGAETGPWAGDDVRGFKDMDVVVCVDLTPDEVQSLLDATLAATA